MVWHVNDPQGQQTFVPGHVVVGFRDETSFADAEQFVQNEIKPKRVTFEFRDHPQLGSLRRADIYVEPGTEEQVMQKLTACPLVDPALVARMLKPILMNEAKLTGEEVLDITGVADAVDGGRIVVIDKPKEKLDHEWIAKQLGAEIVGKVEGPIHGMAGAANLTRLYQKRMKEVRDAKKVEGQEGDVGGPDGGGPGGPAGSQEAGN